MIILVATTSFEATFGGVRVSKIAASAEQVSAAASWVSRLTGGCRKTARGRRWLTGGARLSVSVRINSSIDEELSRFRGSRADMRRTNAPLA